MRGISPSCLPVHSRGRLRHDAIPFRSAIDSTPQCPAVPDRWLVRRRLAVRITALAGVVATLLAARPARAAHGFELGTGWQNTGALQGTLEWQPAIQGSRKDVPAFLGWRYLGERRVYYAPFARINYTNFWSLGGGGNLLGVTLAPAGLGVYLTRPPAALSPEARRGRWFATFEINLGSFAIGGNITPDRPIDPRVPDPDAQRATLRSDIAQYGGVRPETGFAQRYPLGSYQYAALAVPIQFRVWNMVTERTGVGFFLESNPVMLEWNIGNGGSNTPAYGYNVTAGLSALLF